MLDNLALLLLIVEKGGMAAAGRELGLAPATVSARLAALEKHFGAQLLYRTTRSLSPTAEGRVLLDGARRVLADMEELEASVRLGADRLAGQVRISAPADLGRSWLVPQLDRVLGEQPDLRVDLHLSDSYVDLVEGGYDLALRYGDLHDSSLRVRALGHVTNMVCASPAYLERAGVPARPEELAEHNCLVMRFSGDPFRHWGFLVDGESRRVTVRGDRTSNDSELIRQWCLAGHGIALKADAEIAPYLRSGELVRLLREFEAAPWPVQLVYPGGRAPSRRVRHIIDRLVAAGLPDVPE